MHCERPNHSAYPQGGATDVERSSGGAFEESHGERERFGLEAFACSAQVVPSCSSPGREEEEDPEIADHRMDVGAFMSSQTGKMV